MIKYCHICYEVDGIEDHNICDICDEIYCEGCSYTFSLHYQHQGSRCYICADQSRRERLTIIEKRDKKIRFISMEKKHREMSDLFMSYVSGEKPHTTEDIKWVVSQLPKIKLSDTDDSRDWDIGDIMADGEMLHYEIIGG